MWRFKLHAEKNLRLRSRPSLQRPCEGLEGLSAGAVCSTTLLAARYSTGTPEFKVKIDGNLLQ